MLTELEPQVRESTLVCAAQRGDRAAFGELYRQSERLVHAILLCHVNYNFVEDLMQDVFVKALERIAELRDPAAFRPWLLAIARRVATDHHRTQERPLRAVLGSPVSRRTPETEAFAVLEQIRKLPEAYRETLVLRLVEGMSGPEIAARTHLSADSVRVNLCRGMKLLRDALRGGGVR